MKHQKYAIAALVAIVVLLGGIRYWTHTTPSQTHDTLQPSDEIWAITDTHYLSPDLHDDGEAFQTMQNTAAGKDLRYTKERMEALIHQVEARHPKALIVSGDLTFNGEYQSAEELAGFFGQIEQLGTTVLVIPGNHDIADGWARQFEAEKNIKIKQITRSDWAKLFASYGYGEASSRDAQSLSYVAKPFDNLWFLMIDSNIYTEQGDGKGAPKTNGVVKKETLAWMERQLQEAQDASVRIIPVIHHNVLDHHEQVTSGFTVDNASDVRALFAKFPTVTFGLSGHIHSQHIQTDTLSEKHPYTEVVNGAFSIYPAAIGSFSLDDTGIHYKRITLDTNSWASNTQQTNPDLIDHATYLKTVFDDASRTLVHQSIYEEQWYDGEMANDISNFIAPLNLAYFTGEKLDANWLTQDFYASSAFQALQEHADTSFLYQYAMQIIQENQRGNNLSVDAP